MPVRPAKDSSVVASLRRRKRVRILFQPQGGTREIFLSHFVRQYRAIDEAGGMAVLDLYEDMPHIFQVRPEMAGAPETKTALKKMAAFLQRRMGD